MAERGAREGNGATLGRRKEVSGRRSARAEQESRVPFRIQRMRPTRGPVTTILRESDGGEIPREPKDRMRPAAAMVGERYHADQPSLGFPGRSPRVRVGPQRYASGRELLTELLAGDHSADLVRLAETFAAVIGVVPPTLRRPTQRDAGRDRRPWCRGGLSSHAERPREPSISFLSRASSL